MLNIAVSLLAIAATALQVLDVLSTYHMLARGGHEENPIVAWFMQVLGDGSVREPPGPHAFLRVDTIRSRVTSKRIS
jgi:hypothetical protein